MERATFSESEMVEQNTRFLTVYVETANSCLVLLSENEDKLGTLAVAVPALEDTLSIPSSSILLGARNTIAARMLAELVAKRKKKIALVSIFLETIDEMHAQPILRKLVEKMLQPESGGHEEAKAA